MAGNYGGQFPPILKLGAVASGYLKLFQTSCFHHSKGTVGGITEMRLISFSITKISLELVPAE